VSKPIKRIRGSGLHAKLKTTIHRTGGKGKLYMAKGELEVENNGKRFNKPLDRSQNFTKMEGMTTTTEQPRTAFIGLYLTEREKARIQDRAEKDTRSVSDWARIALLKACEDETDNSD